MASRAPYARQTRCVHCGRSEDQHKDGLCPRFAPGETPTQKFATLNLPPGKTCGDCVHLNRCEAIFGHIPADETCDWYPVKFRERVQ